MDLTAFRRDARAHPAGPAAFARAAAARRARRTVGAVLWWVLEDELVLRPRRFGPRERLHIDPSVQLNDCVLNTTSGTITIHAGAFLGFRAQLLAATHDVTVLGAARQAAVPATGCDIEIGPGAWIASGAIVLGPCVVGADAVVAAGAVVTGTVAPRTVVGGVPARVLREL